MSSLLSLDEVVNRLTGGNSGTPEHTFFWKRGGFTAAVSNASLTTGVPCSAWNWDGWPGVSTSAPTNTAAALDNTSAGALKQADPGGGRQKWLLGFEACSASASGGTVVLYDRLLQIGGLSGTIANPQTVQGNAGAGTCTITLATPGVVSLTAHGFGIGQRVRFTTTGALPTGLTAGTDYWVVSSGWTANSFQVSASKAGASVTTSVSQSGVHTVTGQVDSGITRYTDGLGNFAMTEVYASIGTTPNTVTGLYTDQDGNTGNSTLSIPLGGTAASTPSRIYHTAQLPLASGDVGVRAVDSITLSGSSGTAGNLGVTIGHELARVVLPHTGYGAARDLISGWPDMVEIKTGACLALLFMPIGTNAPLSLAGALHMVER